MQTRLSVFPTITHIVCNVNLYVAFRSGVNVSQHPNHNGILSTALSLKAPLPSLSKEYSLRAVVSTWILRLSEYVQQVEV